MNTSSVSRVLGAALTCCLLGPAAAFAADGESTPLDLAEQPVRAAGSTPGAGGGGLVRTIVGLAVVIGVIYGLSWILKQVKASKEERSSGAGLAPLATLPLGPNRSLHLIRAGSELVLVGAGEHGVTPIRTYSEAEARSLGLLDDGDGDGDGGDAPRGGKGGAVAAGPFGGTPSSLGGRVGSALKLSRLMDDLRARTVIK